MFCLSVFDFRISFSGIRLLDILVQALGCINKVYISGYG